MNRSPQGFLLMIKETQKDRIGSDRTRVNPRPMPLGTARKLNPNCPRICRYHCDAVSIPVSSQPMQIDQYARARSQHKTEPSRGFKPTIQQPRGWQNKPSRQPRHCEHDGPWHGKCEAKRITQPWKGSLAYPTDHRQQGKVCWLYHS